MKKNCYICLLNKKYVKFCIHTINLQNQAKLMRNKLKQTTHGIKYQKITNHIIVHELRGKQIHQATILINYCRQRQTTNTSLREYIDVSNQIEDDRCQSKIPKWNVKGLQTALLAVRDAYRTRNADNCWSQTKTCRGKGDLIVNR